MTRDEQKELKKFEIADKRAMRIKVITYTCTGKHVFAEGVEKRKKVVFAQSERDDKRAIITANRVMNCVESMYVEEQVLDGFGWCVESGGLEEVDVG